MFSKINQGLELLKVLCFVNLQIDLCNHYVFTEKYLICNLLTIRILHGKVVLCILQNSNCLTTARLKFRLEDNIKMDLYSFPNMKQT